ncbi:hypothetical protein TTHERM_01103820 (macronuclear) [Tetrahymena thermophila SB210]|uniref:Uncharacterized protein n=1 Tax=Tetrahymena thermophila (strain SB210) TaxID=312017 RepID=Q24D78_TETTS|nr:hypothetical protein TTHERM_01103820 [Tetrahymena thermophila SB210]EAS05711.3 hypothetical protein TTHERM_01103820 [Tetrahymena thermophila SB210]|eukprot:XP_001025956.3 hypothetical protein TTHERM_01103820 [Tetrahymena thermophila SB210]
MRCQNPYKKEQQKFCKSSFQSEYDSCSFTQLSCFDTKILAKQFDQQTNDSQELTEIDSSFSDNVQMQVEGFEMNDLLAKFECISKNNISKNIIKSFFSYLLDKKNNDLLTDFVEKGVQLTQARKMAKNYFKSYGFNNNSLNKLIQHPKYGKAFEFYLTFEAEIWLAGSKVQQKETHLIYIDFLKLCCSNLKYSDHLVTYKKNKKSKFNNKI